MNFFSENIRYTKKGIELVDKHGNALDNKDALFKAKKRVISWFLDLKLFLVHLVSLHIPFHTIRRLVFVISGVKMKKGAVIHMGCRFFEPRGVSVGVDTKVGNGAFLDGRAPLIIKDHVDIASEVMIYNSEHDIDDPEFKAIVGKVEINDYCFIGPRAIILPGVSIGRGAVVAAGAVVTKNVEDYTIVGGVPARAIGKRNNENLHYKLGRARLFQ